MNCSFWAIAGAAAIGPANTAAPTAAMSIFFALMLYLPCETKQACLLSGKL
jgi:hypothetical protein